MMGQRKKERCHVKMGAQGQIDGQTVRLSHQENEWEEEREKEMDETKDESISEG